MGLRSLTKAEIFDCGHNPPKRRLVRTGLEGPVYEKLPNMRTERWVNAKGNVIHLSLACGGVLNEADCAREARDRRSQMRASGGIPHHECPTRTGDIDESDFPESLRNVCAVGSYGRGRACPHVEHVVSVRQGENTSKLAAVEERRRANMEQDKVRHEEVIDALTNIGKMAETQAPTKKASK